ncbi:type II toxin-antitoxin system mRNA interferase toxin, RelE/StbE family [Patescibacteria group bacterium]|nr:type II toxin-antitoxin system mRNA interferase toxin, RelE/StbE family [Patescibacteria group bacterium]MCL5010125.1 type II toxin-antitoxin system mRNA interferase toxin, RelE/StbE family [Patescibacteria group bacterium]
MNAKLDPNFSKKLKKLNVKIRKSFRKKIFIFIKNPLDPQLNNHKLREPYKGLRSINITNDYRAIYREIKTGEDTIAYFIILGTHKELYK